MDYAHVLDILHSDDELIQDFLDHVHRKSTKRGGMTKRLDRLPVQRHYEAKMDAVGTHLIEIVMKGAEVGVVEAVPDNLQCFELVRLSL